jgi:hypothetical protein
MKQPVIVARRVSGTWFLVLEGIPPSKAETLDLQDPTDRVRLQAYSYACQLECRLGVDPQSLRLVDASTDYWRDICQESTDILCTHINSEPLYKLFTLDTATLEYVTRFYVYKSHTLAIVRSTLRTFYADGNEQIHMRECEGEYGKAFVFCSPIDPNRWTRLF